MKRELTVKTYELAYHLVPDLEEGAMATQIKDIEGLITLSGGIIITSQKPNKIHLSYHIRHYHYAHFGVLDFTGPSDIIGKLGSQMKLQTNILRYLVLSKEMNPKKEVRTLGQQRTQSNAKASASESPTLAKGGATTEKTKQMDKEIETILENI